MNKSKLFATLTAIEKAVFIIIGGAVVLLSVTVNSTSSVTALLLMAVVIGILEYSSATKVTGKDLTGIINPYVWNPIWAILLYALGAFEVYLMGDFPLSIMPVTSLIYGAIASVAIAELLTYATRGLRNSAKEE